MAQVSRVKSKSSYRAETWKGQHCRKLCQSLKNKKFVIPWTAPRCTRLGPEKRQSSWEGVACLPVAGPNQEMPGSCSTEKLRVQLD